MKKIFFLLAASALPIILAAQSFRVSGTVIDDKTQLPLSGASVFCQNTTIGTLTNTNGEFTLNLPAGGYDVVVSYSGFQTQSLHINQQTENATTLRFVLKEKSKEMEEVAVVATTEVKNGWEKYGSFFSEQFIGITENSASCTIDNPTVLRFFFSKKRNRLKVIASEDLVISNNALGYKIKYQLDSFVHEYGSTVTQYTGYPLFEEMQGSPEQIEKWNGKREEAYLGSLTHFMKSYYDKTLGGEGFKLEFTDPKSNKTRPVNDPYDSAFAIMEGEELDLHPPGNLRVIYLRELPEQGYLIKNKLSLDNTVQISQVSFRDGVGVESNGYFYDQRDLLSIGYWGWEKLADFMPYNYKTNVGIR